MSVNTQALIDAVVSTALATGRFDRVNTHEPKAPPGNGLHAAVWVQKIAPVSSSGLASTSTYFIVNIRLYLNMIQEPQDSIDPAMCSATDDLLSAFSAAFTLGGLVREVDLLGTHGQMLDATAGYITIDRTMYRCMTLNVPLIVNDSYDQGA